MSSSEAARLAVLAAEAEALVRALAARGAASTAPAEAARALARAAAGLHGARFEEGLREPALGRDHGLSATSALAFTGAVLADADLALFELGMWQAWSGTRARHEQQGGIHALPIE